MECKENKKMKEKEMEMGLGFIDRPGLVGLVGSGETLVIYVVKHGPGVWRRVEHHKTQIDDVVDLVKNLSKRPNRDSLSDERLEHTHSKVAKFGVLEKVNVDSLALKDDNIVNESILHGDSRFQTISSVNSLKPDSVICGESDEGSKVQSSIKTEISMSRSQPAC
ncbi:hypothetical protein QYF36_006232 [Acer negundo]|nr:hypothetical protein QYF36_006232 [Acer negundo]